MASRATSAATQTRSMRSATTHATPAASASATMTACSRTVLPPRTQTPRRSTSSSAIATWVSYRGSTRPSATARAATLRSRPPATRRSRTSAARQCTC
eukprot:6458168-Prymnesium_polylepis.1